MVTAKEGLKFIGKTGLFVPVMEGQNGGVLYRVQDDKHYAVSGTKGYLWMEADMALARGADIDVSYFESLVADAEKTIGKFGDFDRFVS
jgi:hypothetical protein